MQFIKKVGAILLSVCFCGAMCACATGDPDPEPGRDPQTESGVFAEDLVTNGRTFVSADDGFDHSYARIVESDAGTLIATAEELNNNFGGIPIWRSTDGGATFVKNAANVEDPDATATMNAQWQPTLYVLPQDIAGGDLEKGDILLVATSINGTGVDTMTEGSINLYVSKDDGLSFTWYSRVAHSYVNTPAHPEQNGVWEGNLIVNAEGQVACFYADETDHVNHAQRIVYKTTSDGKTWSEAVEVVALENAGMRPGMPSVTQIKDGVYFLVIEMVGENGVPIYWKTSVDGIDWGDPNNKGTKISVTETITDAVTGNERSTEVFPTSSPFCVWTPKGYDENGTIFVTSMISTYSGSQPTDVSLIDFWVSYDLGANWERIHHPIPYTNANNRPAYSNSMCLSKDGESLYVVNTVQNRAGSNLNCVVFTEADLDASLVAA